MEHGMAEGIVQGSFSPGRLPESRGPISLDLAVFPLVGRELSVLLTERTESPYPAFWALPGALRRKGISLDAQARSLQSAVTGTDGGWIEQLKTFDRPQQVDSGGRIEVPGRDPRGDVLSVAYIAIVPTALAQACAESAPTSSFSASSRAGCARNQMVSSKPERSSLRSRELDDLVAAALREDLGRELGGADITTKYVVDADLMGEARIIAKKGGVLSGADAAARVFEKVDPPCDYVAVEPDGTQLEPGDEVAQVIGPLASILTAERTALNFLQLLSAIATC